MLSRRAVLLGAILAPGLVHAQADPAREAAVLPAAPEADYGKP